MRADGEKNMGRRTEQLEKRGATFAFSINTNRFFFKKKKNQIRFSSEKYFRSRAFFLPEKNLKNKTLKGHNLKKNPKNWLDCHHKCTLNKSNEGRRCSI